jgi:L-alanine-DL-glutamate epimerase-like enolase superfamily enzyme
MKITRIRLYRQFQPFRDGPYTVSGGRTALGFDSAIVAIETDRGLTGWGEMSPLGSYYSEAFSAGARAGIAELAPILIGQDPRQSEAIARLLDLHMMGQPYVKSALDMACWDLKARAAEQPLCETLGGRFGDAIQLYRSISQEAPDAMARRAQKYLKEGYRRLQVKVGGDPLLDVERFNAVRDAVGKDVVLFCDANGGWTVGDARRFLLAVGDADFVMEQPCYSYSECKALKAHCRQPMVLDESITSLEALMTAIADGVVDGVTIKISRVGGVGKARLIRDVAVARRLPVTVEDTGGAEIDTAAMIHLSLSTPEQYRLHTVDFHNWVTIGHGDGIPQTKDGLLFPPTGPGLGIAVRDNDLGEPIFETTKSGA